MLLRWPTQQFTFIPQYIACDKPYGKGWWNFPSHQQSNFCGINNMQCTVSSLCSHRASWDAQRCTPSRATACRMSLQRTYPLHPNFIDIDILRPKWPHASWSSIQLRQEILIRWWNPDEVINRCCSSLHRAPLLHNGSKIVKGCQLHSTYSTTLYSQERDNCPWRIHTERLESTITKQPNAVKRLWATQMVYEGL